MMTKEYMEIPAVAGPLRGSTLQMVPREIDECSGILVFGKHIKSLLFSTDVALIRNSNADAVIAVYPFTPQPVISQAILLVADVPVFCGVGGGLTCGTRAVAMAVEAEKQGATGVVLNAPTPNETIERLAGYLDVPIVVTVASDGTDIDGRLLAGADIFNVAAGKRTAALVARIRDEYPGVPIIATGGSTPGSILATIEAGANAITWTPPSCAELLGGVMDNYRQGKPYA